MIHILGCFPYLEKHVYGKKEDGWLFLPVQTLYTLSNGGMRTYEYFKKIGGEAFIKVMANSSTSKFLEDKDIELMETDIKTPLATSIIVDDELYSFDKDEYPNVEVDKQNLYALLTLSSIKKKDTVVLYEREGVMDIEVFEDMYKRLQAKEVELICCVHEKYYPIIKQYPCSIFIESQAKVIDEKIENEITSLASIVVVAKKANSLLLLNDEITYQAKYDILESDDCNVYLDAIIAGILYCMDKQEGLDTFLRSAVAMSVGASLSKGLSLVQKETFQTMYQEVEYSKV